MSNWQILKLGEVSKSIKDGTHGTHKNVENGPFLLSAQNVENGRIIINENDRKISEKDFGAIHHNYKMQDNDILITIVGTLGRCTILTNYHNEFTFQRSVAIIRFNEDIILPRFAFYQIQTSRFQKELRRRENKGAQGGIYLGELAKIPMIIPDLETQQIIIRILDTCTDNISYIKELIKSEINLFSGLLHNTLTKPEKKEFRLKDIATIKKGCQINKDTLSNFGIPVINGGINPSGYTDNSNMPAECITISEGGNSCGYVNYLKEDFWLGGHCYAITPKNVNKKLLYYILKNSQREIQRLRVGSGLPNIQIEDLKNFKITVPSPDSQSMIMNLLNSMENKIDYLSQLVIKQERMFKYLLNHLIDGSFDLSNVELKNEKE